MLVLILNIFLDEKDISRGDPIGHIYNYNYEPWSNKFPDVVYIDKMTSNQGRTLISPTSEDFLYYSVRQNYNEHSATN